MKNKLFFLLVVFCFLGLLVHSGCKTAEEAGQYVLTVTVGEGITGTPATGSYNHTNVDLVNFSYSLQSGYENLVVQLDGTTVGNNGIIAMNMNHILNVTADRIFDPNGDWADTYIAVTFSGGFYSGTTLGEFAGWSNGKGTYIITGDQIAFDLNWGAYDCHLWGTINDFNNMSGTWESYSGGSSGTWSMERQ
ncbi:MAG: hypothetical protein KAT17_10855 [Candidatus Aminicenantes bacterium]|nr:hypothetical protein [Candidatus Aminicenantes bacterium]